MRFHRQSPLPQGREDLGVRLEAGALGFAGDDQLVEKCQQPPASHLRGVKIPHRPGGRVPGIGKHRVAGSFPLAIGFLEGGS